MRAAAIWALTVGVFGPAPTPAPTPTPDVQLPAWDEPLPTYDEAPITPDDPFDVAPPPSNEPPITGRGRTAVGAILISGGAVLAATSLAMIITDTDTPAWIAGPILGGGGIIVGAITLAVGQQRKQKHIIWASAQADGPVPPRGDGMLASGVLCMIAGGMGTTIGAVSLVAFQSPGDMPYGQVLIPLGLTSVVTGAGLLAGAGVRAKRYRHWEAGRVTPSFSLLPGTRQSPGGLSLGFAGRF